MMTKVNYDGFVTLMKSTPKTSFQN